MPQTSVSTVTAPRRWLTLSVLGGAQFMLVLDDTVVNVALASIRRDLGFDLPGLTWVVNAYLLAFGGLLLLAGRAADVFGRRRVFLTGIAIFGAASLICGSAQAPWQLVAGRLAQGAGAALASPAALAIVTALFTDERERGRALGIWGALAVLGGTSGVVISGALTGLASWRWIFLVNLPLAAVVLVAVPRLVREDRGQDRPRLHLPAALLGTGAAVCLVQGFLLTGGPVSPLRPLAWFTAAVVLAAWFLIAEGRAADRLVPASLLADPVRRLGTIACLVLAGTFFALSVLLMLHLQNVLGFGPLAAGLAYLPYGAGILLGVAGSPALQNRMGVPSTLTVAFTVAALGVLLLSRLPADGGNYVGDVLPGLVIAAVGSGLGYPAVARAAVSGTTDHDAGVAAAVLNSAQQLGSVLGLAVLVGVAGRRSSVLTTAGAEPSRALTEGLVAALLVGVAVLVLGAVLSALSRAHGSSRAAGSWNGPGRTGM